MNAYVTQTKDFDSSENVPAVKAHFGSTFTPPENSRTWTRLWYGTTRFKKCPAFHRSLSYFEFRNCELIICLLMPNGQLLFCLKRLCDRRSLLKGLFGMYLLGNVITQQVYKTFAFGLNLKRQPQQSCHAA